MSSIQKTLLIGFFTVSLCILLFMCSLVTWIGTWESSEPNNESTNTVEESESENDSLDENSYLVLRVIDGDTVELEEVGVVRLIGIDTPELSGDEGEECYAGEAKEALEHLISGKEVAFEYDESQDMTDRYDRALGYLFIENKNIGEAMLDGGFATEYTYNKDYKYKEQYLAAQTRAKEGSVGLWGDACECAQGEITSSECSACNEKTIQYSNWDCSTYSETVSDESCIAACPAVITPPPTPTSATTYVCNCSKTCPNLSCAEAQYQLNVCGCSARDGDNDGIACDSQCQ